MMCAQISVNCIYSKVMRGGFVFALVLFSSHILKLQYNNTNRMFSSPPFSTLLWLICMHCLLHRFHTYACNLDWLHSACFSASTTPTGSWEMVSEKSRTSKAGMLSEGRSETYVELRGDQDPPHKLHSRFEACVSTACAHSGQKKVI